MISRRIGTPPTSNNGNSINSNNSSSKSSKESSFTMVSSIKRIWSNMTGYMNSTRLMVLVILCMQNSMFTILRRYSLGVLKEEYSKYELLLVAEFIKIIYSVWMVNSTVVCTPLSGEGDDEGVMIPRDLSTHLRYLVSTSKKMVGLALIYGAMNILSLISLRNISAGMFTIFAQTKIITTATFSTIMLKRQYSWTQWRALVALMMGVLLFSEPIWGEASVSVENGNAIVGTVAVLVEVTLSGFASIYFEKVIKTDPLQLGIWERNFQLALGSFPLYIFFIIGNGGGTAGFFGGWSGMTVLLSFLAAAGGLLVALSIKYGDSILKTLATTSAIILTGILDHQFLDGPLTVAMMIAAVQVILSVLNYTFDATPKPISTADAVVSSPPPKNQNQVDAENQETEQLLRRV